MNNFNLPPTWTTRILAECLELNQSGIWGNPPRGDNTDYPILRSTNIQSSGMTLENVAYRNVPPEMINKYMLIDGDILITKSSGSPSLIGKSAIFEKPNAQIYLYSNFIQRLRVKRDIMVPHYLSFYLNSPCAQAFLEKIHNTTSGLRNLDMKLYASQKIPLPPLFEQHRIVAILRQADKLRQLRRFADEKIEQLLPTLFYHMFGDCDPHKEYPEGWEVVSLSSVISSTQYGLSTSLERSGQVGVLRMNNITINGDLDFSDLKYLPTEKVDARLYDLRPGDILFNRTNSKELVGKTGIWDEAKGPYTFASYIIRIRVKSIILPEYLWALLNSAYGKQQVFALGKQAVNMANINTQEFGSILIVLPPKNLQEQFAKLYKSVREQVKLSNQARTPIEALFQSLLSQAFGLFRGGP